MVNKTIHVPAMYISSLRNASTNKGPMVGRFNTIETSALPVMMLGNASDPRMTISGLMAMRTACFQITVLFFRPRARAASTKGWPRVSNRLPRMMRIRPPAPVTALMIAGIQR